MGQKYDGSNKRQGRIHTLLPCISKLPLVPIGSSRLILALPLPFGAGKPPTCCGLGRSSEGRWSKLVRTTGACSGDLREGALAPEIEIRPNKDFLGDGGSSLGGDGEG